MRTIRLLGQTLGLTGIAIHIWTIVIAYQAGASFFGILLTIILPVLGEIYWTIKMIGVNSAYVWTVIIYSCIITLVRFISHAMR